MIKSRRMYFGLIGAFLIIDLIAIGPVLFAKIENDRISQALFLSAVFATYGLMAVCCSVTWSSYRSLSLIGLMTCAAGFIWTTVANLGYSIGSGRMNLCFAVLATALALTNLLLNVKANLRSVQICRAITLVLIAINVLFISRAIFSEWDSMTDLGASEGTLFGPVPEEYPTIIFSLLLLIGVGIALIPVLKRLNARESR